jgi:hypothetical protein
MTETTLTSTPFYLGFYNAELLRLFISIIPWDMINKTHV